MKSHIASKLQWDLTSRQLLFDYLEDHDPLPTHVVSDLKPRAVDGAEKRCIKDSPAFHQLTGLVESRHGKRQEFILRTKQFCLGEVHPRDLLRLLYSVFSDDEAMVRKVVERLASHVIPNQDRGAALLRAFRSHCGLFVNASTPPRNQTYFLITGVEKGGTGTLYGEGNLVLGSLKELRNFLFF
jgi:hypothetical protein